MGLLKLGFVKLFFLFFLLTCLLSSDIIKNYVQLTNIVLSMFKAEVVYI